jgi:C-terminal processing protease CtpA/Prc
MGRRFSVLIVVFFLVICVHPLPQIAADDPSIVSTTTPEGRLAVFDDVWETIQERYYDPTHNGIDWQAKRNVFRPAAAKANSAYELYDVMRQMIASLKDAHTRVYSPDEKFDWWNPRYVTVGLTIREIQGVPVVVQVESGSAAAKTDIHPGDAIVSVDGVRVADYLSNRSRTSDRAAMAHRDRESSPLSSTVSRDVRECGWTTRDGKLKSAALPRYWTQRHLGFSTQRRGKVAILRIDAFTQSVALEFRKHCRRCSKARRHRARLALQRRWRRGSDGRRRVAVSRRRASISASLPIVPGLRLNYKRIRSDSGASATDAHQASARRSHE